MTTEKQRIYIRNWQRKYRKTEKYKKYMYAYNRLPKRKVYWKEYCARLDVKERRKINDAKPKNKIRRRLYMKTTAGKAAMSKWNHSLKGRAYRKANKAVWRVSQNGRVSQNKQNAIRRTIAFQTIQLVYESNIKKYGRLTCYLCSMPIDFGNDHLEHKTPLSRGGAHDFDNLDVACAKCNCKKHNKTLEEFLKCV